MTYTIAERDGWACARCQRRGAHTHHRVLGNRKNNKPSNLIYLCAPCHGYVHAHPAESRDRGWIVSRWNNPADVPVYYHGLWYSLADDWSKNLTDGVEFSE